MWKYPLMLNWEHRLLSIWFAAIVKKVNTNKVVTKWTELLSYWQINSILDVSCYNLSFWQTSRKHKGHQRDLEMRWPFFQLLFSNEWIAGLRALNSSWKTHLAKTSKKPMSELLSRHGLCYGLCESRRWDGCTGEYILFVCRSRSSQSRQCVLHYAHDVPGTLPE